MYYVNFGLIVFVCIIDIFKILKFDNVLYFILVEFEDIFLLWGVDLKIVIEYWF